MLTAKQHSDIIISDMHGSDSLAAEVGQGCMKSWAIVRWDRLPVFC